MTDYLFIVKGNQPSLQDDIRILFDEGIAQRARDFTDEDRSRIRSGHDPENMTLLLRFTIGLIKARGLCVAETMRCLAFAPRRRSSG